MTDNNNFPIDVAFSFLAADEGTALRIAGLLGDRYRTFVYSEHQKELAGRDGEEKFASVFGEQARVVVILFRPGWGKTSWTRIEETAIRNRAHDHGYDFTLWVPMEQIDRLPPWMPKTRLYLNLSRFGDTGLVAVIDQLNQQQGGDVRPETLQERGERMKREVALANARRELIEGYNMDNGMAVAASAKEISDAVVAWAQADTALQPEVRRSGSHAVLFVRNRHPHAPLCMTVHWSQPYTNHVGPAARYVAQTYEGTPEWPGYRIVQQPTPRKAKKFRPDLNAAFDLCWKEEGEEPQHTPAGIAEAIARFFMNEMVEISEQGQRR